MKLTIFNTVLIGLLSIFLICLRVDTRNRTITHTVVKEVKTINCDREDLKEITKSCSAQKDRYEFILCVDQLKETFCAK